MAAKVTRKSSKPLQKGKKMQSVKNLTQLLVRKSGGGQPIEN